MNHSKFQSEEIIERYVRNQLSVEDRRAFQEHFFTCDDCFSQVQMTDRFIGAVRHAAESGLVPDKIVPSEALELSGRWFRWVKPALAITVAATPVLAAAIAWLLLVRLPALREDIAAQRNAREQIEQLKQRQIDELNAQLQREQQSRQSGREEAALARNENTQHREEQAQNTKSSSVRRAGDGASELLAKNVPVVALQATRASQDMNELELPGTGQRFALFIEIAPQARFKSFRLEVFDSTGRIVSSAGRLRVNKQNAVVATLDSQPFAGGDYLVKLYGGSQAQTFLVEEYKLRLSKK